MGIRKQEINGSEDRKKEKKRRLRDEPKRHLNRKEKKKIG